MTDVVADRVIEKQLVSALRHLTQVYGSENVRTTVDKVIVNEALLRSTTDSHVWAAEFAKVRPEIDQGLMIGWFSNCAATAVDLERAARESEMEPPSVDLGLSE